MDKSLFIFLFIGVGFLYFLTDFIGDIQKDDGDIYTDIQYEDKKRFERYQTLDSIGQSILDITDVNLEQQIEAWNASRLKTKYLELFPNFQEMKLFIDNRVRGDDFKIKLIGFTDSVEDDFFSGKIDAEQAIRKLHSFK